MFMRKTAFIFEYLQFHRVVVKTHSVCCAITTSNLSVQLPLCRTMAKNKTFQQPTMFSNSESMQTEAWTHSSFYKFVSLTHPFAVAERIQNLGQQLGILGTIQLAREGINAAIAGSNKPSKTSQSALAQFELAIEDIFGSTHFKHTTCETPPFGKLKVSVKEEIVQLGVSEVQAIDHKPNALPPSAWRALLQRDDLILIDNRNSFEFKLGHFEGAIDPQIENFRDFPQWVEQQLPIWQQQGKTVAMYCTGGIRCDKTSAWLAPRGIDIVTLEGGVINYLQEFPNDSAWLGDCYVFDQRVALDSQLEPQYTPVDAVFPPNSEGQDWRAARAERLNIAALKQHAQNNRSTVVTPQNEASKTILEFLQTRFPHIPKETWIQRISDGLVVDQLGQAISLNSPCKPGMTIHYSRQVIDEIPVPFQEEILFENDAILIVDKPHFLSCQPSGQALEHTLIHRLRRRLNNPHLSLAHRLDRDTAGLVLVTKKIEYRRAYQNLFRDRVVSKTYLAICHDADARYKPMDESEQITNRLERSPEHFMKAIVIPDSVEKPANATTHYQIIGLGEIGSTTDSIALVKLTPLTGQRHQLRVHMNHLGLPIVNDQIYPELYPEPEPTPQAWAKRYNEPLQLLAQSLGFIDPISKQTLEFHSQLSLKYMPNLKIKTN